MANEKPPKGYVTKHEFAQIRGVSVQSVHMAIRDGDIDSIKIGKNVWIDPDKANEQWNKNRRNTGQGQKNIALNDYDKARTLRERANAEKAVLQVAEMKKTLIKKEDVVRQGFLAGQKIRQALESIPAKLGARLAAITDPHKVEITMRDEIEHILFELSNLDGHEFTPVVSENEIEDVKESII